MQEPHLYIDVSSLHQPPGNIKNSPSRRSLHGASLVVHVYVSFMRVCTTLRNDEGGIEGAGAFNR
jgi:hypothetical protein